MIKQKKTLFIFGTRPEAIKLAPLVKAMQAKPDWFDVKVCVTAQHRQMLDQVTSFFGIAPDYDLDLMTADQSLFDITAGSLKGLESIIGGYMPDLIIVQGDTTTAFAGALAGFYYKIKSAHIEAGLRSGDKYSPYPEEINRVLLSHVADYHFAPTQKAADNLRAEGIVDRVHVVGNTVIDALLMGLDIIKSHDDKAYQNYFETIDFSKKIILVTGHRRESFGEPFRQICSAILEIARSYGDVEVVYPVHLNPNVRQPVGEILGSQPNVHLIEPLEYPYLIWLMNKSYFVLTDSGGIQEEAPSLGKPVLVMRNVTERWEGIEAGNAKLVGTVASRIVAECRLLLENTGEYLKMSHTHNPYGDGKSCERIVEILKQ